nr:organic cation transporter protein-like [Cherax quadricarinatus]
MELVGKTRRVLVGVLAQAFYTLGYFSAALLAWSIHSWRWLQVAMTLPALFFIPYYWLIPESSRWLISQGRTAEARLILQHAANLNGKTVSHSFYSNILGLPTTMVSSPGRNFLDLFRHPKPAARKTLTIFFNWFVNSGVYYGLSLNTGNLGGNAYLNFVISGAVELPALAITILLLDRVGRRIPLCFFLVMGGLVLVSTMFIPKDLSWLLITLAMAGKMCITASYAIIYMLTAEIFPTVVRNVGVGSSSMVARVGGALAPYVNLLGDRWKPLPPADIWFTVSHAGLIWLEAEDNEMKNDMKLLQALADNQDSPHQDSPHQDSPHQDSPHQDSPHQDSPQQDSPHQDSPHQDSPHQDSPHQDSPHQDSPHQDSPHQDSPQQDSPHQNSPHQDSPHQDSPHQDSPHQDSPHQDSPQQDSPHQDSPHQDSPHQDSPHQDSPHQDSPHQETSTTADAQIQKEDHSIKVPEGSSLENKNFIAV